MSSFENVKPRTGDLAAQHTNAKTNKCQLDTLVLLQVRARYGWKLSGKCRPLRGPPGELCSATFWTTQLYNHKTRQIWQPLVDLVCLRTDEHKKSHESSVNVTFSRFSSHHQTPVLAVKAMEQSVHS